jgi:hypothetical protein
MSYRKDVIDALMIRKLQTVSKATYAFRNSEGSSSLEAKFVV